MTSADTAALITAFGVSLAAILTAIAAIINARNSAAVVERLKAKIEESENRHTKEIEERDRIRGKIIVRMNFFKRLAIKRESQVNRLMAQVKILNNQVDGIGRMYNQTTLEVFDLRNRLATATGDQSIMGATAPLPPLPDDKA